VACAGSGWTAWAPSRLRLLQRGEVSRRGEPLPPALPLAPLPPADDARAWTPWRPVASAQQDASPRGREKPVSGPSWRTWRRVGVSGQSVSGLPLFSTGPGFDPLPCVRQSSFCPPAQGGVEGLAWPSVWPWDVLSGRYPDCSLP